MMRGLTDTEQAIVLPLIERRAWLESRLADVQLGLNAVIASFHGAPVDGLRLQRGPDDRWILISPDPPASAKVAAARPESSPESEGG